MRCFCTVDWMPLNLSVTSWLRVSMLRIYFSRRFADNELFINLYMQKFDLFAFYSLVQLADNLGSYLNV